eukprot:969415-Pyramimonas_sp.AAC.1
MNVMTRWCGTVRPPQEASDRKAVLGTFRGQPDFIRKHCVPWVERYFDTPPRPDLPRRLKKT